jgi:hypothetical protein
VTEWEIAEHHYKLGRVLFAMGDGPQKEVSALSGNAGSATGCRARSSVAHCHGASSHAGGPSQHNR